MTLVKSNLSCKNCESNLDDQAAFCNICGAKVITEPFTFKYLKDDFADKFLDIDNNLLFRTLKDMLLRPEFVIQSYIDGVRRRHLKLANWIALALTLTGVLIFIIKRFYPEAIDVSFMLDPSNPMAQNFDAESFGNFMEYQGIMYILFIPIYAFISKLSFYNQKHFSYLKHIVFIGYTQAFLSIILFIPLLIYVMLGYNYIASSYIVMGIMFLYSCYCYKRMFKLSFGKLLVRILIFLGIAILALILYVIVIVVVMILNGSMQEAMEAEKARRGIGYMVSSAINWTS